MSDVVSLVAWLSRHSNDIAPATGKDEDALLAMGQRAKTENDQLRTALATVRDQCNRQEHGFAKRESALQRELAAALKAYDAEVIGRRDEVTGCHAEMGKLRTSLAAAEARVKELEEKLTATIDRAGRML